MSNLNEPGGQLIKNFAPTRRNYQWPPKGHRLGAAAKAVNGDINNVRKQELDEVRVRERDGMYNNGFCVRFATWRATRLSAATAHRRGASSTGLNTSRAKTSTFSAPK